MVVAPERVRREPAVQRPVRATLSVSSVYVAQAAGLLVVALGIAIVRSGSGWGEPVFLLGMLAVWVPAAARVVGGEITRNEGAALVVGTGMALYCVKLLYTPLSFDLHDEYLHWRTASDIVETERLFNENSVLPVSPLYPGLEIATSAVVKLTGLSTYVAGTILIGAARFITTLALYLLYEVVGGSWIASVAALIYMTNPKFIFFDALYSYETLALALALLALCLVARRPPVRGVDRMAFTGLVVLILAAVSFTHHITSFVLVGVLVLLAVAAVVLRETGSRLWLSSVAACAVLFVSGWLVVVAREVVDYLAPTLGAGFAEVVDLIRREGSSRQLFRSHGETAPVWERAGILVWTAITLVCLPFAVLRIWRQRRFDAFVVVFFLGFVAYPASGFFRLTRSGAEAADRSSAFVFVAVAFLCALAILGNVRKSRSRSWIAGTTVVMSLLFYGGFALSGARWSRFPGPYLVAGDERSVEREGISAASWTRRFLGADNRIATDRVNRLLMFTHGRQRPVTALADGIDVSPLFFSPHIFRYERRLLRRGAIEYVIADYRLTRGLPALGFFYEPTEEGALTHRTPIQRAAYAKFDRLSLATRTFDSGNIVIYDVRRVSRGG